MNLETRLEICSDILSKYLPLISQMDMDVIEDFETRVKHPWIDQVGNFTNEELVHFDAYREFDLLQSPDWIELISKIKSVTHFDKVESKQSNFTSYGNQKKQHELAMLYSYLEDLKAKELEVVDFGGGVGNLAFFLENELNMQPLVIEKDIDLINKGEKRVCRHKSNISFKHSMVDKDFKLEHIKAKDLGIGLHTCGNFAPDMMDACARNNVEQIINFGCCYSKIQDDKYHLSSKANHKLKFSARALAGATLGFNKTIREIYDFRIRIMDYKFSFYHYVSQKYGIHQFCPMSNSRKSLYSLPFYEFMKISLNKFYPEKELESEKEVLSFYESEQNRKLNSYFQNYFAISRYIGEVLEIYILTDRALYLQELGYKVEIKQFFDSQISPRNKGIIASRV